jgi:hypothetical protein
MTESPLDYICNVCCKNPNGAFDFVAALDRLFAARINTASIEAAAKREFILMRGESPVSTMAANMGTNAACSIIDQASADILARVGGFFGRQPVLVPGDGD